MSKFTKALRDFLVFEDTDYVYPASNVVHLNTPHARAHARANAEQAALLDRQERDAMLTELLRQKRAERDQLNAEIFDLENEQERLRG
jgi:hypothetical protein